MYLSLLQYNYFILLIFLRGTLLCQRVYSFAFSLSLCSYVHLYICPTVSLVDICIKVTGSLKMLYYGWLMYLAYVLPIAAVSSQILLGHGHGGKTDIVHHGTGQWYI